MGGVTSRSSLIRLQTLIKSQQRERDKKMRKIKKTELKAKLVSLVFIALMTLFYERKETPDEVIIRYKYLPLIYIVLIGGLIFSILLDEITSTSWGFLVWAFIFILLLIFIIDIHKPSKEIREAMKKSYVKISGSKFSFFNPYTVVIKKRGK